MSTLMWWIVGASGVAIILNLIALIATAMRESDRR